MIASYSRPAWAIQQDIFCLKIEIKSKTNPKIFNWNQESLSVHKITKEFTLRENTKYIYSGWDLIQFFYLKILQIIPEKIPMSEQCNIL